MTRSIPTLGLVILAAAISAPWILILYQSNWFDDQAARPSDRGETPPPDSLVEERATEGGGEPMGELEALEDIISEGNDSSLLASEASLSGWTWADEGAATMLPLTLAELAASERAEHNPLAAEEAELARRQAELDEAEMQLQVDAEAEVDREQWLAEQSYLGDQNAYYDGYGVWGSPVYIDNNYYGYDYYNRYCYGLGLSGYVFYDFPHYLGHFRHHNRHHHHHHKHHKSRKHGKRDDPGFDITNVPNPPRHRPDQLFLGPFERGDGRDDPQWARRDERSQRQVDSAPRSPRGGGRSGDVVDDGFPDRAGAAQQRRAEAREAQLVEASTRLEPSPEQLLEDRRRLERERALIAQREAVERGRRQRLAEEQRERSLVELQRRAAEQQRLERIETMRRQQEVQERRIAAQRQRQAGEVSTGRVREVPTSPFRPGSSDRSRNGGGSIAEPRTVSRAPRSNSRSYSPPESRAPTSRATQPSRTRSMPGAVPSRSTPRASTPSPGRSRPTSRASAPSRPAPRASAPSSSRASSASSSRSSHRGGPFRR